MARSISIAAGRRWELVWLVAAWCAVPELMQAFAVQPAGKMTTSIQRASLVPASTALRFKLGSSGHFWGGVAETPIQKPSRLQARTVPAAMALLLAAGHRRSRSVTSHAEVESKSEGPAKDSSGSLVVQAGLFLSYFTLQSTMSFFMKFLLSKVRVAENLLGIPASFLVTASQQLVGLTFFLVFLGGSYLVGKPYSPKKISGKEFLLVLALSISFSLNIGFNLLSISLLPLSLTMIIRSCTPLTTAAVQTLLLRKKQDISAREWVCVSTGVVCATAVVIAQSGSPSGKASSAFFFGVTISVLSLLSGGLDFVFKSILGTNVKLNAVDTVCYQALPVAAFTAILGVLITKPVSATWAARFAPKMTDLAVFMKLWEVNPAIFGYVVLSGALAFCYNTFVTFLVVKLSPATAAFAGNFNKAATILLSLIFLEATLPTSARGLVVVGAVVGNITAFTLYNVLRKRRLSSK